MTLSGLIENTALIADFDARTSSLSAQASLDSYGDWPVLVRAAGSAMTNHASLRRIDFTPPDDFELRALRVLCLHTATGRTVTASLTVADGDSSFLLDHTISQAVASINGTANATLDCRTTTGAIRVKLLRGVRYRLALETTGAVSSAQAVLLLRSTRRTR